MTTAKLEVMARRRADDARGRAAHLVDAQPPNISHLNQVTLARRWGVSERTLERWRRQTKWPHYIKLGGHVAYRLEDAEAFERTQRRG